MDADVKKAIDLVMDISSDLAMKGVESEDIPTMTLAVTKALVYGVVVESLRRVTPAA